MIQEVKTGWKQGQCEHLELIRKIKERGGDKRDVSGRNEKFQK
jgi:hypothetical protein